MGWLPHQEFLLSSSYRDEKDMVLACQYQGWKKQGLVVTRDSRSRLQGAKPHLTKVSYKMSITLLVITNSGGHLEDISFILPRQGGGCQIVQ